MQKVKLIKKYKEYKARQVIEVGNNEAHGLIEKGIAKMFIGYKNKMLTNYNNKNGISNISRRKNISRNRKQRKR